MLEAFREAQLPLLALVLVTAGLAKLALRGPRRPADNVRPDLVQLLRDHHRLGAAVAVTECGLGAALLTVPLPAVRLAVAVWFAGATWIVDELRARRPEEGCGCFGTLSSTRIGRRVLIRPLLLTAAATATMGVPVTGLAVLSQTPGLATLIVALELAALLALSPEVGVLPARRTRPACELRAVSLTDTVRTLHRSAAWREYGAILTGSAPTEVWRELCWRFMVFPGRLARTDVEVVFAVSLAGERRPVVRVALVETVPEAVLEAALDATVATTYHPNPTTTPVPA
jgi:hypothetical protein